MLQNILSRNLVFIIIALFFSVSSFAQDKTKKQLKEESRIDVQNQLETLIGAKDFVFKANTASPMGYKPVGLTPNMYYVRFTTDMVISFLPYYGNSYGNMGFNNDSGLKFEGVPEDYVSSKGKKSYQVKVKVRAEGNAYTFILTVRFDGVTTLSVSSNNRGNIVFDGYLSSSENLQQ